MTFVIADFSLRHVKKFAFKANLAYNSKEELAKDVIADTVIYISELAYSGLVLDLLHRFLE